MAAKIAVARRAGCAARCRQLAISRMRCIIPQIGNGFSAQHTRFSMISGRLQVPLHIAGLAYPLGNCSCKIARQRSMIMPDSAPEHSVISITESVIIPCMHSIVPKPTETLKLSPLHLTRPECPALSRYSRTPVAANPLLVWCGHDSIGISNT